MNIFYWLTGALLTNIVARIAVAVGLSVVSYIGFDALLTLVFNSMQTAFLSLDNVPLSILGIAGVDRAVNYIFSAYSARLVISALTKWRVR